MPIGKFGRRELLLSMGASGLAVLASNCAFAGQRKQLRNAEATSQLNAAPAGMALMPAGAIAVFTSGQDGYACMRVPAMVTSRKGTILAFCEGRRDSCSDEGNIDVILRRSIDGGRTWGQLQVIANDGRNPCKNPVPVVLPNGRILLLWLWNEWIASKKERTTRKVYITQSDDDGLTWERSREITSQVYRPGWTWYGLGPCHGMVKQLAPAAGRIIVPARHGGGRGYKQHAHLIYSDDGGKSWMIGGISKLESTGESSVAELGDGGIMLNSRSSLGLRVLSISRDGGKTIQSSQVSNLIEPRSGALVGCQGSFLTYTLNAATRQATLLFSNPMDSVNRTNGRLRVSKDNGKTWSNGLLYSNPRPAFSGYSDITVLPNRDVGILFESGDSYEKYADGQESPSAPIGRKKRKSAGKEKKEKLRRHDVIAFRRFTPAQFLNL